MLDIHSLINYEDSEGRTLLFSAIEKNDLKMIKELIEAGANVNHVSQSDTILTFAYRKNRMSLINNYFYTIKDKFEERVIQSLVSVVDGKHLDMVNKFSLNINRQTYMPLLHKATQDGNVELVKKLIEQGVNINLENKDGIRAPFLMTKKLKSQVVIDLLEVFRHAGFDFSFETKKGKTVANHLLSLYEGKKKIAQYVEVYKLPINYFATVSDEYLNEHCFFNESTYVKEKMNTDTEFFKNQLFPQLNAQNLEKINIRNVHDFGNNSIFSLLEFMKNNNYSINTEFSYWTSKMTILEKVAQKYLSVFSHQNYSFSESEDKAKNEWGILFSLIRDKILNFKELDLNQLKELEFNGKTSVSPLYFSACILYFFKDHIIKNINNNVIDLSLRSSSNSTVINHCLNQENLSLIPLFLKQNKIDYNQTNNEGANLVLEVSNILSRDNFKRINKTFVEKMLWDVIDNCPFTDLELVDKKNNTLEKNLKSLGLFTEFKERQEQIEKAWLENTTHHQKQGKKIKL
jgi:hypothetical protein